MVFKQEVSVTVRVTLFGRHVESMMRAPTRFFASAMCLNLEFCFIAGTLARVRRRVHSMTGVSNYKSVMRSSTIAQQARREARRSSQRADNADIVFEMAMSATSIRPMLPYPKP
jgi:hypothetical protein